MPYLPLLDTKYKKKKKKIINSRYITQWTSPPATILIYKTNGSHLIMIKKKKSLYIE